MNSSAPRATELIRTSSIDPRKPSPNGFVVAVALFTVLPSLPIVTGPRSEKSTRSAAEPTELATIAPESTRVKNNSVVPRAFPVAKSTNPLDVKTAAAWTTRQSQVRCQLQLPQLM